MQLPILQKSENSKNQTGVDITLKIDYQYPIKKNLEEVL